MNAETDLETLLRNMSPRSDGRRFVFCTLTEADLEGLNFKPLATFRESEGVSVIIEQAQADALGIAYQGVWAFITLTVHSDLSAVGFLAAITTRLATAGISVNPVSAFYHDHLFVPHDKTDEVIALLNDFSKE